MLETMVCRILVHLYVAFWSSISGPAELRARASEGGRVLGQSTAATADGDWFELRSILLVSRKDIDST